MKSKVTVLLCCLLSLSGFAKTTLIKGKILGKPPKTIHYTAPVNGSLGFDYYFTAQPDTVGNFEIELDLAETTIVDIFYDYKFATSVVITPGAAYSVNITEKEGKITTDLAASDSEGQKQYTAIVNGHRQLLISNLIRDVGKLETAAAVKTELSRREAADIKPFSDLLVAGKISNAFFEAVKRDRNYFYPIVTGQIAFLKQIYAQQGQSVTGLQDFYTLWGTAFDKYPITDKVIQKSPFGFYYLDAYRSYKVSFDNKFKPLNSETLSLYKVTGRMKELLGANTEYYVAATLHSYLVEGRMELELIPIYEDFIKEYPASGYIKFLQTEMAPMAEFSNQKTSLADGAAFVNDYGNINSLEELIKKFPGKKLYIDVWATWCGPCREEFQYKESLYKLLAEQDVTPVYISIDEDKRDETWKKMINYYGLKGQHIRANKLLDAALRNLYNDKGSISIPWYIIINTDGSISTLHAAGVSKMEGLKTQLQKL